MYGRRKATVCVGLAAVGLSLCTLASAAEIRDPKENVFREVLPASITPLHYDLAIVPDPAALTFRGKVEITLEYFRKPAPLPSTL